MVCFIFCSLIIDTHVCALVPLRLQDVTLFIVSEWSIISFQIFNSACLNYMHYSSPNIFSPQVPTVSSNDIVFSGPSAPKEIDPSAFVCKPLKMGFRFILKIILHYFYDTIKQWVELT